MIQETIRAITDEERASLPPLYVPHYTAPTPPGYRQEAWMLAASPIAILIYIAIMGVPRGPKAAGVISASMVPVVLFITAYLKDARFRRAHRSYVVPQPLVFPTVRDDGRVLVKRVRAVAVVEIEEVEDEGPGWLYELGDGRVLFLKGLDYLPMDDETPWPSTEFEIIRAQVDGEFIAMAYHGTRLEPVRVIRRGEYNAEEMWDDREEVHEGTLDEVIRTHVVKR